MDALDAVEKLAGLARREPPPATDVGGRVLAGVRDRQEQSLAPLWVFAGSTSVTAAAVALVAVRAWVSLSSWFCGMYWSGQLDAIIPSFRMVMP
jgi:hypothetical protein